MGRCAVIIVTLLCGSAAWSGEVDPKLAAKTHFRAGTAFYEGGEYDKAVAEYQEAYRLLPLPVFLFNLGQATRLKGDRSAAIAFYKRYLEAKPTGAVADEARSQLSQLESAAAQDQSNAAAAGNGALTTVPQGGLAAPPKVAPSLAATAPSPSAAPSAAVVAPPTVAQPSDRPLYRRKWVWALTGGVVAAVALGVGLGVGLSGRTQNPTPSYGAVGLK
jgi:tetratricopeptide (TPR) repeat protein